MRKSLFNLVLLSIISISPAFAINNVEPTDESNLEALLKETASAIDISYRTLAEAKSKGVSKKMLDTQTLNTVEAGLGELINLDWSGPIEPVLQKLSNMTNYNLKVIGKRPAIPVLVTLVKEGETVADTIKDANLQANNRANIIVYPKERIIELRYLP